MMHVGPTPCGKSDIRNILTTCKTEDNHAHEIVVVNPKVIADSQMYSVEAPISEELASGVFEIKSLRNASPTTVSCAGIIFVSGSEFGWEPLYQAQPSVGFG